MTSATLPASSHVNAGAPTGQAAIRTGHRLGVGGVLRSEWIKLGSLRSVRLTLLVTLAAGIALNALIAFVLSGEFEGVPAEALSSYLLMTSTFAAPFLALIFGVLGVFTISSEYSSGMILSTLAAVPRRMPVFVAKAVVLSLLAAFTAAVIVGAGLGFGVAALPASAGQLADPVVVSGALGTVGYLVLVALMAFGVAGLLRSTAGGIAVVVTLTFVLPIAFQMLSLTGWEWVPVVANYLPTPLGSVLSQGLVDSAAATGAVTVEGQAVANGPGYWEALGSMAAWAAAPIVPAAILFKTRDAK